MKKLNRKTFISVIALIFGGTVVKAAPSYKMKKQLIHHVFFWLKNTGSKDDLNKLLEGLQTLSKIETVRQIHIGVPAGTETRDVIDSSYSASELLFFDDLEGQKIYQDHPVHQAFIKNYAHLWGKVVVYDVVNV